MADGAFKQKHPDRVAQEIMELDERYRAATTPDRRLAYYLRTARPKWGLKWRSEGTEGAKAVAQGILDRCGLTAAQVKRLTGHAEG